MHKGFRTRTTYAANHRIAAQRSSATIYATEAGEGILHQTCSGAAQGFTTPIVERQRADSTPLYFVQSEKFADRYYGLYRQQDGTWFFSGDAKLASTYIAKVEAFQQAQQPAEVEVVEESGYIAPTVNGPWRGITVHISDAEMAEIHQQVRAERLAAMSEAEREAFLKAEAFEKVWDQVRAIERKYAATRAYRSLRQHEAVVA